MSPDTRALVRLAAELRRDLAAARQRLDGLRVRRAGLVPDDPVIASFFALSLHAYYTALETACERVARHFDGGVPTGERRHQDLLDSMGLDLPGIRPRVFSERTLEGLRELLGFRHFVRHAYAIAWRLDRLAALTDLALALHDEVARELEELLAFIDALTSA